MKIKKFSKLSEQVIGAALEVHKTLGPGFHAQLLSYIKLAKVKQGFLINFNVELLKHGLKSFVLKPS